MLIVSCVEFIPLQLPTTVSFKCVLISILTSVHAKGSLLFGMGKLKLDKIQHMKLDKVQEHIESYVEERVLIDILFDELCIIIMAHITMYARRSAPLCTDTVGGAYGGRWASDGGV